MFFLCLYGTIKQVNHIHTDKKNIALLLGKLYEHEICKDVVFYFWCRNLPRQGFFMFKIYKCMRHQENKNPNLSEAQALEALRYEISCVQSFYPELAELRNTLQELFILSVSANCY